MKMELYSGNLTKYEIYRLLNFYFFYLTSLLQNIYIHYFKSNNRLDPDLDPLVQDIFLNNLLQTGNNSF